MYRSHANTDADRDADVDADAMSMWTPTRMMRERRERGETWERNKN